MPGKVTPREGGWGFAASGQFQLQPDEALVVTLDTLGAKYVGFQLTDPWAISTDYIEHQGSLNNHQAVPNADGTFTYVIAARDPGVANWLDTSGLADGFFQIRWQKLPASTNAEAAVKSAKVVKRLRRSPFTLCIDHCDQWPKREQELLPDGQSYTLALAHDF